ncbi:MAG TPA: hypothetical protein VHI93_09145, partial [Candidatus Thermoplasmatota archaeon]|nr:hypothetical protein [Candidatus Thermoplasmatota archaeon]
MRRLAAALLALAFLATLSPAAHADGLPSVAALKEAALPKALAYLEAFAERQGRGDEYLVEAIEGAGLNPGLWPTRAANILDSTRIPAVVRPANDTNDPIREIAAYAQTGYPLHVGGRDLVADLKAEWAGSPQGVGQAAFTILGLHAAGLPDSDPVIQERVRNLQAGQAAGGAWLCPVSNVGLVQSVDCTGMALTALAAVHALLPSTASLAKAWLDQVRNPDGGYQYNPNMAVPESNTQSTIWAINGYRAVGASEPEASWRYILGLQQADGSFAHSAGRPTDKHAWPTKEIVASFWRSFATWPVHSPAGVLLPPLHAGVPAILSLSDPRLTQVTWVATGPAGTAASGHTATLALDAPGPWDLAIDARGDGVHHRERLGATVHNDPPAFMGLPAKLVADRVAPLAFTALSADPEGQAVTLAWSLDGTPGEGPIVARFDALGSHTLRLVATDPHGAEAVAEVAIEVANLPPRIEELQLPALVPPGAPFAYGATASDPDGPPPTLRWAFDGAEAPGPGGRMTL